MFVCPLAKIDNLFKLIFQASDLIGNKYSKFFLATRITVKRFKNMFYFHSHNFGMLRI